MMVQGFSGSILELANHLSKRAASDQVLLPSAFLGEP